MAKLFFLFSVLTLAGLHFRSVSAEDATGRQFWRPGGFAGIPLFNNLRLQNTACNSESGEVGTCLAENDCTTRQGINIGQCGRSNLVCCSQKFTCNGKTNKNETVFVNPNYPSGENGTNTCQVTVENVPGVCQLRLDLEEFELAQPDDNGICAKDSYMVRTTAGERLPMLCGQNKGQHMYVDMGRGSANPVVLSVITNDQDVVNRKWKIRITFIKCDNYVMAPSGCLQYYRSPSDVVKSFNYGPRIEGRSRYLSNLRYTTCIRVEENFCAIKWSTEGGETFSWGMSSENQQYQSNLNNNNNTVDASEAGLYGMACNDDDFIGIDQGSVEGYGVGEDRFCGNKLFDNNVVVSRSKPFQLKVRSNSDQSENARFSQNGYALRYTQLPCVN